MASRPHGLRASPPPPVAAAATAGGLAGATKPIIALAPARRHRMSAADGFTAFGSKTTTLKKNKINSIFKQRSSDTRKK